MVKDFILYAYVLRERILERILCVYWTFGCKGSRKREDKRELMGARWWNAGGRKLLIIKWFSGITNVCALVSCMHFRNSSQGGSHFTYGINVAHAWLYMHSLRTSYSNPNESNSSKVHSSQRWSRCNCSCIIDA